MKKNEVKCNICGCINKINNISNDFECINCHNVININNCIIINNDARNIEYYIHDLKNNVINQNNVKINEISKKILSIDYKNFLGNYFILNINDRIIYLLNQIDYNKDIEFIYRYDIIFNKNISMEAKKKLINNIKNEKDKEKFNLYISNQDDLKSDNELYKKINKIPFTMNVYIEKSKSLKKTYIILSFISLLTLVLITLLCYLNKKTSCDYAIIVLIDLIPIFFLNIFISRILNIKKIWIRIIMFIVLYIILSYIMTVPYHNGDFLETIINHFKQIIYSFRDIINEINSKGYVGGEE